MDKNYVSRNRIQETLKSDIIHDLEGPIEKVIEYLKKVKDSLPDYELSLNIHYGYESIHLELLGVRGETEKERTSRLAGEKKDREAKKKKEADNRAKELKELERLKAKYETNQ